MSIAKRSILICIVFVSCVGCDQTTKRIALSTLPETQTMSYLGDTLRLQFVHNQGAFLSLGSSLPETWRYVLFIVGSGLLLFGALAYAFVLNPGRPSVVLALALIFAGGVSNLFDRIANGGVVIDFLNVGIGPLRTGIFNIADITIFGGLFIFIFAKCFTLTVQKSRMPQIQGVKGEAVVSYRKPLTTKEMWYFLLSRRVKNMTN